VWVSWFWDLQLGNDSKEALNKYRFVIPAYAGIQGNNKLDPGHRLGDVLFRIPLTRISRHYTGSLREKPQATVLRLVNHINRAQQAALCEAGLDLFARPDAGGRVQDAPVLLPGDDSVAAVKRGQRTDRVQ